MGIPEGVYSSESFTIKFNILDDDTGYWKIGETKEVQAYVTCDNMFDEAELVFLDIKNYREKLRKKELKIVRITYH